MIGNKTARAKRFRATLFRACDLVHAELPPMQPLMTYTTNGFPVICRRDLIELYAERGVGKSMFAMGLALALATKTEFLCWKTVAQSKVLYIDGEMPSYKVKDRLTQMCQRQGITPPANLAFIARDWQSSPMPRMDTPEGMASVANLLDQKWSNKDDAAIEMVDGPIELKHWGASVLILDNAACLLDPESEKDATAWQPAKEWLLGLRDHGITVVLVHHAGRSGASRGHSAKEDIMDTTLSLVRPEGYTQRQGCKFKVQFTKGRSLWGDAAESFKAVYDDNGWAWELKKGKMLSKVEEDDTDTDVIDAEVLYFIDQNPKLGYNKIEQGVRRGSAPIREAIKRLLAQNLVVKGEKGGFSAK